MPLDIENRKIGGDHPRLRDPGSFPPTDRRGGRGGHPLRGTADRERKEGKDRRDRQKAGSLQGGHVDPPLPNDRSKAQILGRTASFTVIFAFFFSSTRYASTAFAPFSFRNA